MTPPRPLVVAGTGMALATLAAACGSGASTAPSTTTRPPSTHRTGAPSASTTATTAPSATTAPPTSTTVPATSTTAPGGSPSALVTTLQAFFAAGCDGGCNQLTEPASAFSVVLDQHDPAWARWEVVDPSVGSGYGFAHDSGGTWAVVAGPGTGAVGCPPSRQTVPAEVLADFGGTCPSPTT